MHGDRLRLVVDAAAPYCQEEVENCNGGEL